MRIERPVRHDALVERLWNAARTGRLPHAFLLQGPAGIGKFVALRWFAAGLLCERGPAAPCGTCGPCKRVASGGFRGNHPDLFVLDPLELGEEQIRVGHVARRSDGPGDAGGGSLEDFLALRAAEGGHRPVLVREAHRMNAAAQNALLKTLEEPRPGTLLLLETHRPDGLLPTITSRCVRARLEPLAPDEATRVLEGLGVEADRALGLARLAPGSPGRALEAERRGTAELVALLEAVLAGRETPLAAAARAWEIEGEFPGARASAQARERARHACETALGLVQDLVRRGADAPAVPRSALEALLECRADVDRNLAPEAIVERAFLVLGDLGALSSTLARSGP